MTRRETYAEDIPYGTTTVEDDRYYKGYEVTLSAGVPGQQEVTADVTYIDGERVGETRIGTPVVLSEPVNERVLVGTLPILTYLPSGGGSSDSFMWPVKGGYVTAGLYGYPGPHRHGHRRPRGHRDPRRQGRPGHLRHQLCPSGPTASRCG